MSGVGLDLAEVRSVNVSRSRTANETDMASWSCSVSRQRDETIISYITILIRRRVSQNLNCRFGHGESKWGAQTDVVVVIRRGSFICSGRSQRDHHAALIKWCDQCRINSNAIDGRGEHANCLFNWQKKKNLSDLITTSVNFLEDLCKKKKKINR